MSEHLVVEDRPGGIRVVTLNRPSKLNAWNAQMRTEMAEAIDQASVEEDLRALILTGAGRAFSAGEDVGGMDDLASSGTKRFRVVARRIHDVFDVLEAMEVPVIAAVNGVAAGGGFELSLSCDFRIVAEDARFVMPEVKVGLIPGSGGCSRLVKLVGLGRAKELVMLGEPLTAERAYEIGIATDVVQSGEALAASIRCAERIAELAPLAVGIAKTTLNACVDVDRDTGRQLERIAQSVLRTSEDHQEGVKAFQEKRAPKWRGR